MNTRPNPRFPRALFRIRAKLLVATAALVVAPIAGLVFARTYERELLRSEEEGMTALARALAAAIADDAAAGRPLNGSATAAAMQSAASSLGAQVRVIDAAGRALADTGPERIEVRTHGRTLADDFERSRAPTLAVGDPEPPDGDFRARPEVRRALEGHAGRFTRASRRVRAVRLYVAEPVARRGGPVAAVVYVSRTTYPVLVSLYRVRNGLVRVAAVCLALAAAVASFLALTISRPLRRLTSAAERIAAGERGVELKHSGRDEIADLARAFDAMARELDARLGYASELAANVSHEFKTPIASIRGAAELLREGAADDPEARQRFLGNILEDTERLARLVTLLLELSRIEARPEPAVPLDYRALLECIVARYRAEGCEVSIEYAARNAYLRGSSEQLASALRNLVDNALRFSPAGSRVTVRVSADGDGLRTDVSDEGRGISEASLARVWERFFTTARESGGTGLGLPIVRAIVESHGGSVGARSTEGQGSVFWFTLPRRL